MSALIALLIFHKSLMLKITVYKGAFCKKKKLYIYVNNIRRKYIFFSIFNLRPWFLIVFQQIETRFFP